MTNTYTYDPDAWHPAVAGLAAGGVGAIVTALLAVVLRSPDEIVANSLTVAATSLTLGLVAGLLWRRLRASHRAELAFSIAMAAGWFVAMVAITIVDQAVLSNLIPYAAPIAAIIFVTLAFLTPVFARVTASMWLAAIPVAIAIALGIGLFGRGNVASGELSLDDLETVPTTRTDDPVTTSSGSAGASESTTTAGDASATLTLDDLAASYSITTGRATYSVEETLQGLSTVGVGETEAITGTFEPNGTFAFTIDLESFESDQSRRDQRVRGWFAGSPEGTLDGSGFSIPSSAAVGEVVSFDVTGDMTVNGITHPVTWAIDARVEGDGTISVTGETSIVLSDFDIPVVTGGLVTMTDGATIEVLFSAAPDG